MSRGKNTEHKKPTNSPNGIVDRNSQPDPVKTEGTTEVPTFSTSDDRDERFAEMEKQKEKDIKKLVKESDGTPKA